MIRTTLKPLAFALTAATLATQAPAVFADVNVDLRTFYFNRDFSEGTNQSREALTQALRVDYVGQATDSLTLGASLFANVKLADDDDSASTGLLDENEDGYAKLGQIFADFSFTETLSVKAGRWVVDTPLLNDSDSRGTPSSTQAIKLSNTYESGKVYVLYTDRASGKTDSSFTKYRDGNGDSYGVALIGGDITLDNGLTLTAAHGHADGFAKQTYLSAGMQVNDQVAVGLIHYIGDGEGTNTANLDANMTNVFGSYTTGNLRLSAGYQTVSGDTAYNYAWGGADDNGLMTTNAVQIMDFNNQDEDSWQLRADYTVAAVQGLSVMARHTDGEYTNGGNEVDEAETNVEMAYAVQGGALEGLNLRMRVSHVEADAYDDINEIRLIANYSF